MDFGSSTAWLFLCVIVMVLDVLCVVTISHYRNHYHGTDITLLLIIVPMALNAVFTLPIPAVITIGNYPWTQELCSLYIWIFCTLRLTQILGLLCLSLQWAFFMRITGEAQSKISTFAAPWIMAGAMVLSGLVGILPVAGVANDSYFNARDKTCAFLPYEWGVGFSVFFVILVCAMTCASTVCLADATLLLRHMKKVAVTKYRAERFHVPVSISTKYRHGKRNVQDRYGELIFASDLCRFVFVFVMFSTIVNHLPFAIIQCVQLVFTPDRDVIETITLWLVLADCLLLPHTLWILSKRYRHGLIYFWKVHILRNTTAEEDPMACMLQFYGKTGGGENGSLRAISNYQNPTLERLPRAGLAGFTDKTGDNGYPASRGVEELSPIDRNHDSASVSVHASRDVAASVVTGPLKIRESQPGEVSVRVHAVNSDSSSLQSPVKRFMSNPDLVERSSSRSRQEWKEQMRRKHLPAIFVNDAFEKEDSSNAVQNSSPPVSIDPQPVEKSHKKEGSNSSLYYFCGEYHPDNLTSSFSKPPTESESDGMSYQYDTVDISIVLDDTSSQTGAKITESKPFGSVSSGAKPPKKPVRKQQSMGKIGQNSAKTENSSIISDSSVVITPNIPMGRPVWPDDPETFEISEPFRDAKTFPSATSSQRSNSPSIHFDEEVDKGFEEALAIGYASVSALDSVPYFQSISEEPGGSLGLPDDNNPFSEDNLDDTRSEGSFVTQAVVSKHRHRHYSSESENPFDKVPINSSKPKTNIKNNHQSGNGDSGTGTWADYSNGFIDAEIREDDEAFTYKTRDPNSSSLPWPDDKVSNSHDRMSFDSDFSEDRFDEPTTQNGKVSIITKDYKEIHDQTSGDLNSGAKTSQTLKYDAAYF